MKNEKNNIKNIKKIVYIHGAWSSSISFNYLKTNLPHHNGLLVDYKTNKNLYFISEDIKEKIKNIFKNEKYSIIGHSLGGIIGHLIAQSDYDCENLITLASPYGGSLFGSILLNNIKDDFIQEIPTNPLEIIKSKLFDTCLLPNSNFLKSLKKLEHCFHVSVIAEGGSFPIFTEKNDNVLTLSSQDKTNAEIKIYLKTTHHEILLHKETLDIIKKYIFNDK